MKKITMKALGCAAFTFLSATTALAQTAPTDSARSEFRGFALEVVQMYFSQNCEAFYDIISDSVFVMDGDGIVAKQPFRNKLCKSVKNAIKDSTKTMQDYLDCYEISILSAQEVVAKYGKDLPGYYTPMDGDYFFMGGDLKNQKNRCNDFLWDDMFFFMARKENNRWVIKGVSG